MHISYHGSRKTAAFRIEHFFVNSQHQNTNSKGDFVLKNQFLAVVLKIYDIQKYIIVYQFIKFYLSMILPKD